MKFVIRLFLLFSILAACKPTTPEILVKIPSFREYYPILLKEAQEWRTDAYLHDARIFLFPRSSDSYHISAGFYSPSADSESLAVDLLQDGTITSEIFIHEYPVYHHEPITENDWKIDGQEAMGYMINEAGLQFLDPDKNYCSFTILQRVLPTQDQPVIWSLTLWDCADAVQHLYLDANSGEILNSSAVNIQPTRFPTPTP